MTTTELHQAMDLLEHRRSLWRALLDFQPLAPAIEELASRSVAEAELDPLPPIEGDAEPFIEAFIEAVVGVDGRLALSDRLCADLEQPPKGSPLAVRRTAAQRRWVARVQARRCALVAARQSFAERHAALVTALARRYKSTQLIPHADLIQEGSIGLMIAVDRFDPRLGYRFSTYAAWWIRHAITRALSDRGRTVRLPVHVVELRARIRKVSAELERRLSRTPTDEELAQACELPLPKVERLSRVLTRQDTPAPVAGEPGHADPLDRLADAEVDPTTVFDGSACLDIVERGLDELRPLEHSILRMRFGLDDTAPMSLREIGEVHALSRERIRQVQNRALGKLRAALEREGLASPFG